MFDVRVADHYPVLACAAAAKAAERSNSGEIVPGANAARRARLELGDAADLPSAQQLAPELRLIAEEWQVVDVVDDQNVARVELRWPPQVMSVIGVRDDVSLVRSVVVTRRE